MQKKCFANEIAKKYNVPRATLYERKKKPY